MKLSRIKLPLIALAGGAAALAVRIWLYRTGIDAKGLVITGHPASILSYVLMILIPAVLFLLSRAASENQPHTCSIGPVALAGSFLGSAGIVYTALTELSAQSGFLGKFSSVLGIVAGIAMLVAGVFRFRKTAPPYYLHALVTIYFIIHILSQYQVWNIESQLQFYLPHLFASVFLMLSAYYRANLEAGGKNLRLFRFLNYGASFFCCMAICGTAPIFYSAMLIWTVTADCPILPGKDDCHETDEAA